MAINQWIGKMNSAG